MNQRREYGGTGMRQFEIFCKYLFLDPFVYMVGFHGFALNVVLPSVLLCVGYIVDLESFSLICGCKTGKYFGFERGSHACKFLSSTSLSIGTERKHLSCVLR
jgi:hypothetical protein